MPRDNARAAIEARAWSASHVEAYPGGPLITPAEATALGNEQPYRDYQIRRRALFDQWDTWAASGGESTGSFLGDLLGGFFK